jgi:predicted transcriptional regulator
MKIAISLPDALFDAAERLAHELDMPRSQLYAEALAAYLGTHGGAAITARLNAVHDAAAAPLDPAFTQAQRRVLDDAAW